MYNMYYFCYCNKLKKMQMRKCIFFLRTTFMLEITDIHTHTQISFSFYSKTIEGKGG